MPLVVQSYTYTYDYDGSISSPGNYGSWQQERLRHAARSSLYLSQMLSQCYPYLSLSLDVLCVPAAFRSLSIVLDLSASAQASRGPEAGLPLSPAQDVPKGSPPRAHEVLEPRVLLPAAPGSGSDPRLLLQKVCRDRGERPWQALRGSDCRVLASEPTEAA